MKYDYLKKKKKGKQKLILIRRKEIQRNIEKEGIDVII
jgi:hypothetical protein